MNLGKFFPHPDGFEILQVYFRLFGMFSARNATGQLSIIRLALLLGVRISIQMAGVLRSWTTYADLVNAVSILLDKLIIL